MTVITDAIIPALLLGMLWRMIAMERRLTKVEVLLTRLNHNLKANGEVNYGRTEKAQEQEGNNIL